MFVVAIDVDVWISFFDVLYSIRHVREVRDAEDTVSRSFDSALSLPSLVACSLLSFELFSLLPHSIRSFSFSFLNRLASLIFF